MVWESSTVSDNALPVTFNLTYGILAHKPCHSFVSLEFVISVVIAVPFEVPDAHGEDLIATVTENVEFHIDLNKIFRLYLNVKND